MFILQVEPKEPAIYTGLRSQRKATRSFTLILVRKMCEFE